MVSRDLKFRVWDSHRSCEEMIPSENLELSIKNGRLCYISYSKAPNSSCSSSGCYLDLDRYKVMQWTGEKDMNEVDIYEGDIVEYDYRDGIAIVEFEDAEFNLDPIGNCSWIDPWWDKRRWYRLSVVGNVFKNPELIKQYENR